MMIRLKKITAVLIGWVIPLFLLGPLIWWSGDDVEARLFPVLQNQSVSNLAWEGENLCWDWTATKARDAMQVGYAWQLTVDDGDTYSVMVLADGKPMRSSASTVTGQTQTRHLCVDIPEPLSSRDHLVVRGNARYLTWHGRWLVPQVLHGVEWPGDLGRIDR